MNEIRYSIISLIIFSLIVPSFSMVPLVFAENICGEAIKATCTNIAEINVDEVQRRCSDSIFQDFYNKVLKCKSEYEEEKEKLESEIENIEKKERSAEWYLSRLNLDIRYLNYEISNLNLSISQLESEIEKREKAIKELENALSYQKEILTQTLREIYEYDMVTYIAAFIEYDSLSDFGAKLVEMENIQQNLRVAMKEIQNAKEKTEKEKRAMEKDRAEKLEYKKAQEYSRYSLAVKKEQQEYLLGHLVAAKTPLEREMARIEAELIELRVAMEEIQKYLAQWILEGEVTWSAIFSAVQRASSATGVRSALLLGVLQIESRFGTGLGIPGHYKEYCNWGWGSCNHLEVLLELCQKYGYDPNNVPMSKRCALGPAQFLPCTWKGYMGLANPWNLNDAVMAMAKLLARNGATSGNERGALYIYNRSWSYVDAVLASAEAWQDILDICGFDLSCPQLRERLEEKFGEIPIE